MGNRLGGKIPPRPDFSTQQKHGKRTEKLEGSNVDVDALTPQLHAAAFLSTGDHWGDTFTTPLNPVLHTQARVESTSNKDSDPNFVSMIIEEEKHLLSCLPDDRGHAGRRADSTTANCGSTSDITCSQTALHSPSARRRNVLKPSNVQNDPHIPKGEFTVPQIFSDISSSVSFPKHRCLDADPHIRVDDGANSSAAASNLTTACIDRLDYLKRNIEQRNTEHLTHFNNTGFAQLQCEAGYDDYDNTSNSKRSDARAHRRSKSMSPKTAAMIGAPQLDDRTKSTVVRKLSEPGHFLYRINSILPGGWSKSEENSPVIIRKALPNPGNPLIVQRTPSQSPSVERRFPANGPTNWVVSGNCVEPVDTLKPKQHVHHKPLIQQQDCLESRDTSHSIRQKVTAEISLPRVSISPISVRKMPESPVLLSSGSQHQGKGKVREQATRGTIDERSVLDWTPAGTHKLHCRKTCTLSSCSSSSSEHPNGKLSCREDNVSPPIPLGSSSTSSSATPCSSPLTPILFCPQSKGTPVRTCTMVSQPSTAVVLGSRENQIGFQTTAMAMPPRDTETGHQNTTGQLYDCKETQAFSTPSHKQPTSSVVTEDTIKQNSQSAVFGSVSPKLLRHRRLIKNNSNHCHHQHTFPKQSQSTHITTANTSPRNGENSVSMISKTTSCTCADRYQHVHTNDDERLSQLSQSAPSSFSSHGSSLSGPCMGNKTLGQRIREVINEATVGTRLNKETSVSITKHTTVFSIDDIFTSTSASVKSSLNSSKSTNKCQTLLCDKHLPVGKENMTGLTRERQEAKTTGEHRIKVPLSHHAAKHTIQDTFHNISGHSYHLNSSRDSCASCVSDSSQMDSFDGSCFPGEAELTQANLCHRTQWFADGTKSKQQVVLSAQLEVPGHRLVTSDTSDTLSTDRDTSGSSKRESSTSTATDDTLTSFKTRSTADSADYDEGFVLPESLVFIRSTDKDTQNDMCAFDSEQATIKRKLIQGHLHEVHAEHEFLPHKTRKKRRKQFHVQSQIITASRQHTEGTLTRSGTAREVYSDAISDDSDLFDSKDDISDLPSSRDDISDLPSSRDDISDLPSSRDDISDLPSSRDDISDLPSSRDDISDFPCKKTKAPGGLNSVCNFSDNGAIQRFVFHRSDLHSSTHPIHGFADESKSIVRKPAALCVASTELSDKDTHRIYKRCSSSSQGSCVSLPKLPGHVTDSGTFLSESHDRHITPGTRPKATDSAALSTRPPCSDPHKRLTTAAHSKTSQSVRAEEPDSCQQTQGSSGCAHDADKGKQLLIQCSESPGSENTVVLSCTIYNSSCQSDGACD